MLKPGGKLIDQTVGRRLLETLPTGRATAPTVVRGSGGPRVPPTANSSINTP